MHFRDYLDWCELSGLYLRNYSHEDRYRTFARRISAEGLNTLVIAEFLNDNPGELNIPDWRTYSVYEMSGERNQRIQRTAAALEAIGATRAAEAVRTAKSQSPFDALMKLDIGNPDALMDAVKGLNPMEMLGHIRETAARMMPELAGQMGIAPDPGSQSAPGGTESRDEVEKLLAEYVSRHQQQLEGDLAKHGDPRQAPGFTREGRLEELERERVKLITREAQSDDLPKLRALMKDLEKRLGGGQEVAERMRSKMETTRQRFLDLLKENKKRAANAPVPEMTEFLREAEQFVRDNPAIFAQQPVGDEGLERRLAAIGEYERRFAGGEARLIWEQPRGLACAWNRFELALVYPRDGQPALRVLLDVAERLQQRISELSDQWRRHLIEHFREREGWLDDWEREDLELDEEGRVTEESILEQAGTGEIVLHAYDEAGEEIETVTYFSIEWDEEHGLEIPWEDAPVEEPSDTAEFSLGKVRIVDDGPSVSEATLNRLEQQFGIELPGDYRRFLRMHNGGIPQPNHLPLRYQGEVMPYDVECFFSVAVSGSEGSIPPERSLETALETARGKSLPPAMLPIARLKPVASGPSSGEHLLFLVLSGKKARRVVLFDNPMMELPADRNLDEAAVAGMMEQMLEYAFTAAKSLEDLFKKLKAPPQVQLPDWLRLIRENDIDGFLGWLESGGKLNESFTSYGESFSRSVIDYLTQDASPELLTELRTRKRIKPKQIRQSWQQFLRFDVDRFRQLMPILPKDLWPYVLCSPRVWDQPELLEELAEAGIDFNSPVDDEGATPIHLAVQAGNKTAVKWLMEHGADPRKNDKYRRNAFVWAESDPGYDCLPILEGKEDQPEPAGIASADSPGVAALSEAAGQLPPGVGLVLSIQIKSPPVTRVEKVYYSECHYLLSIDVRGNKVTFKDMTSPRQDYLYADQWPSFLFAPILQWPELTPLWQTLEVREIDWQQATKKRNYEGPVREDLFEAARSVLEQAFDPEEAAARGIRLRKT